MWLELLTQLGLVGALVRERHGPVAESNAFRSYLQSLLGPTALRLGWELVPGERVLLCFFYKKLIFHM